MPYSSLLVRNSSPLSETLLISFSFGLGSTNGLGLVLSWSSPHCDFNPLILSGWRRCCCGGGVLIEDSLLGHLITLAG